MALTQTKKIDTNTYELTVAVDAAKFNEGIAKVYARDSKKIEVPGFRKGKAPQKMIEKMYGESVFFEAAVELLYPDAANEAVIESGLQLVAQPKIDITTVSKESGFIFTMVCVCKPEVKVSDYKGIEVEKVVTAVTDEDVANRLKSMQERNARMNDVEGRATEQGDTVVFDFCGYVDGEKFEGGEAEGFSLELGSGQFIPGFEDQMVGKNVEEEFDVNVTFPEDYHAEELKGKEAVFKCTIHNIKAKELPALDDEFAKDVSEFDTLEELKADITAKMTEQNEKAAEVDVENKLIDTVIEKMEAEIPEEMYENEVDNFMQDFEQRLMSQGLNMDLYLQYTGMEKESMRKTFREQAEKRVKIRLALEQIVKEENIVAPFEKIEEAYAQMAEQYKTDVENVKKAIPQEYVAEDVAVQMAVDLVKENAVIK